MALTIVIAKSTRFLKTKDLTSLKLERQPYRLKIRLPNLRGRRSFSKALYFNKFELYTVCNISDCFSKIRTYTYLLTVWSTVLLEKLTGFAANQEIPRILWKTRKFITVLTSARHLSLSWANSIQFSQPLPTSWRSIWILSSHLRLGLRNGLFPSGFLTKTLCIPVTSSIRACPAHLILLDFITWPLPWRIYQSEAVFFNSVISITLKWSSFETSCKWHRPYGSVVRQVIHEWVPLFVVEANHI